MGAKSCAKSFHNQYGSPSGPGAVRLFRQKTYNSRLINGRNSSAYRNWYELGGYVIRIRVYILKV